MQKKKRQTTEDSDWMQGDGHCTADVAAYDQYESHGGRQLDVSQTFGVEDVSKRFQYVSVVFKWLDFF